MAVVATGKQGRELAAKKGGCSGALAFSNHGLLARRWRSAYIASALFGEISDGAAMEPRQLAL